MRRTARAGAPNSSEGARRPVREPERLRPARQGSKRLPSTRERSTAANAAAVLLASGLLLVLAGCELPSPTGAPSSASTAGTATAEPTPTVAPEPVAADVRATGTPVQVGAVTFTVRAELPGATLTPAPQPDGSTTLALTVPTGTVAPAVTARVAAPEGAVLDVQVDGSVALRDAAGAFLGGLAAPTAASDDGTRLRASLDVTAPDLLTLTVTPGLPADTFAAAATATLWFGSAVLESATWGEREGGRSLAVDPTPWARAGGLAAQDGTWAAVVAAEPEADTNGMHDQFLCHALGAPDKGTWNLEPWRPDVGSLSTLAARCNPE
jgi:hypothetical protein